MENQTESYGCRNLFCALFVAFASYKFAKWDIDTIDAYTSDADFEIFNLWKLAFVLTLTAGWFAFVLVLLVLLWEKVSFLKYIEIFLLVIFGPNLLIWTCIGSAINGFNLRDFRSPEDNYKIHPVALLIKIFVWGSLFTLSTLCCAKLFFTTREYFNKAINRRRNIETCQRLKRYPCLIGESCAVCLETFSEENLICELQCTHKFHPCCIQSWIVEKGTCPMCRSPTSI